MNVSAWSGIFDPAFCWVCRHSANLRLMTKRLYPTCTRVRFWTQTVCSANWSPAGRMSRFFTRYLLFFSLTAGMAAGGRVAFVTWPPILTIFLVACPGGTSLFSSIRSPTGSSLWPSFISWGSLLVLFGDYHSPRYSDDRQVRQHREKWLWIGRCRSDGRASWVQRHLLGVLLATWGCSGTLEVPVWVLPWVRWEPIVDLALIWMVCRC